MRKLLLFLFSLLLFFFVKAQEFKKVLGIPEHIENPRDKPEKEMLDYLKQKSSYDKLRPWLVMSDRVNNISYNKANVESGQRASLEFKSVYYVVEEEQDWIHVVNLSRALENGSLSIIKGTDITDKGWVKKQSMVLWQRTLRSSENGIYLKSLLLYSDRALTSGKGGDFGKSIKLYDGPGEKFSPLGSQFLYEFFFILKKENGWLLLTTDNTIEKRQHDVRVLGWIPEENQAAWNTRLALEPNFSKAAYQERKDNTSLRVNLFYQSLDAVEYFNTGKINQANVMAIYDPVVVSEKDKSKDGLRFKGIKMRLPAIVSDEKYFKTGLLSSPPGKQDNLKINDEVQQSFIQYKKSSASWNILFLIEASLSMRQWKEEIISSLSEIKKNLNSELNINLSVAFYRDPKLNGQTPYFSIKNRSNDIDMISDFISKQEFLEEGPDQHTTLQYAINQSILKAGFGENETNVIYLIANNPDCNDDALLMKDCHSCPEKVSVNELADQLVEKDIHFITINPKYSDSYLRQELQNKIEDIMLESSKGLFEKTKNIRTLLKKNLDYKNPEIVNSKDGSEIIGPFTFAYIGPTGSSKEMSKDEMAKAISNTFQNIMEGQKATIDFFNKTLLSGESFQDVQDDPAVGEFASTIIEKLQSLIISSGNQVSQDVINSLVSRKVRFYREGYVARKSPIAKENALAPVLFFPMQELIGYVQELENFSSLRNKPENELRRGLIDLLKELFNKYSGNKKKAPKDLDLNSICRALAGNGFTFDREGNFTIRDLTSDKMHLDVILKFVDEIIAKKDRLSNMMNRPKMFDDYIYVTQTGETYFWIPFDEAF
jgi:hypothetical protein